MNDVGTYFANSVAVECNIKSWCCSMTIDTAGGAERTAIFVWLVARLSRNWAKVVGASSSLYLWTSKKTDRETHLHLLLDLYLRSRRSFPSLLCVLQRLFSKINRFSATLIYISSQEKNILLFIERATFWNLDDKRYDLSAVFFETTSWFINVPQFIRIWKLA
jgi:hypothetical protein